MGAGLWLNIPDYDAPTQMVKPAERNTKYIDMVMTIPKVWSLHSTGLSLAADCEVNGELSKRRTWAGAWQHSPVVATLRLCRLEGGMHGIAVHVHGRHGPTPDEPSLATP